MSIIEQLASSQGRRDEDLNIKLAQQLADQNNKSLIIELFDLLNNKNKSIQNDSIKVVYEIGIIKPQLIADQFEKLIPLLKSKNNRLQWGAMTAINTIAHLKSDEVYKIIPELENIANAGSVITRDNFIYILTTIALDNKYKDKILVLLNKQLLGAPINQVPMYAEKIIPILSDSFKELFLKTLQLRREELPKESQQKRLDKIIKKII